jgi:hypothetical protein
LTNEFSTDKQFIYSLATRVYAQHLFASFMAAFANDVLSLYGDIIDHYDDGSDDRDSNNSPRLKTVFAKIANFFVDCNLGTEEEAYVCIIPPFSNLPKNKLHLLEVLFQVIISNSTISISM